MFVVFIQDEDMDEPLLLRCIIDESNIRKVTLEQRPDSVEELKNKLKDKLQLQYDFQLQYEDPDFNNAPCNLTEIQDLPQKATLKVIPLITLTVTTLSPVPASDSEGSSADTDILPTTGDSPLSSKKKWPEFFDIPNFSVDVEYRLRQGDLRFMSDGTHMNVPRDMKHDILEKLAETIYSFKAYPDDKDFSDVAMALISKHPGLTEPGPQPGWYGWKNSLKFKMGNFRSKLRKAGCDDVTVNGGKRSQMNPGGEASNKNIKRPKRGEVNYFPNVSQGHDEETIDSGRKCLVEEMKKKHPSVSYIAQVMNDTFPMRRQEIVKNKPSVQLMIARWPALFTEGQVSN